MNPSPSVAVVGCGYWGKNLVRVFSELGALRCICDADPARLRAVAPKEGAVAATDRLENVLQDEHCQAVALATPAATHFELVKRCLDAAKDVFVEKPLALTAAEGAQLVELAERSGRILMVGHILLYHPAVIKLHELIREGALGKILYCYSNRLNMGLIRTEENILWSFAPHDISVMLHLLGEEPISAEADGQSYLTPDVVDVTLSRLRFKSGVTGHIFVSWLHPSKEQRFVVVGSEQMAVFDDQAERKLLLYPHKVDWGNRAPRAVKADAVPVELQKAEPLKEECKHFLECVETRRRPVSDGREGLRVLRVLDACQKSLERQPSTPAATTVAPAAPKPDYFAHESAYIDLPCTIGKGTKIWHFSHVMKGAVIGAGCSIGQNVVIGSAAVIGNHVKIQNNVSVYDAVQLEDYVFCGPSMVFTNVVNPRSEIVRKAEYRPTVVKRGATLGANCTIVCGHTIGQYAFIAAGAVVADDVPAYALMAGVPARRIGWMCRCGGSRIEFTAAGDGRCAACGAEYRLAEGAVIACDTPSEPPSPGLPQSTASR